MLEPDVYVMQPRHCTGRTFLRMSRLHNKSKKNISDLIDLYLRLEKNCSGAKKTSVNFFFLKH